MLLDAWILPLLFAQFCSLVLLGYAAAYSLRICFQWNASRADETQLMLEKKGFFVSTATQIALSFQIIFLFMFLFIANYRLPNLLKGVMCATGALGFNDFGYPLLYLKIAAVGLAFIFLVIHYFDNAEPEYPLSPLKYWLLFPLFALVAADVVLAFRYFADLNPDRLATCCSVVFVAQTDDKHTFLEHGNLLKPAFVVFGLSFLGILFAKKIPLLLILLGIIYSLSGIYVLKYFFVSYIYGLPSHHCLFDLFFLQHFGIGYLLFGAYAVLMCSLIFIFLFHIFKAKLREKHLKILRFYRGLGLISLLITAFVPLLFWAMWRGNL